MRQLISAYDAHRSTGWRGNQTTDALDLGEFGPGLWGLLERGAVVYVCGDAARMAPDVRRAFVAVHRAKRGGSDAQAEAWIDGLIRANRYLIDVWASS